MSEVEVTDQQAPAEELVDLILSGELHAANQKYNSIIESKVIEAIEEEKHKISQTLFAEDDDDGDGDDDDVEPKKAKKDDEEEDEDDSPVGKADEGKIPPQFLKGKDKGDDDDDDDSDDDDSDDDDSDSDDDDDDGDKPKKGKVPPQFAKADEGITGDPEANERAIAHNRAMAKKYGQVRQGIPPEKDKEKKEEVEPVDEVSLKTAQNAEIKARMAGPDKRKERQAGKFAQYGQSKAQGGRGIDVRNKTMNQTGPVKKKSYFDTEQADPEHSFDPGEASANVELPKDSFVQQVADNLAGKRR